MLTISLLLSIFILIGLIFYMQTYKKIKRKFKSSDVNETYNTDYVKIINEILGAYEHCKSDFPGDFACLEERIFKFNVLKHLVLRGFYSEASLEQILVVYKILKNDNRFKPSDPMYIEPWALDILKDIRKNLNVFTYILIRYKLGRIFYVLFFYLDMLSINCCMSREFYSNYSKFLLSIPLQIRYMIDVFIEDRESISAFINFYDRDGKPYWYRKENL